MGKAEWGADPEFFGPRHAHREGRITRRLSRLVEETGLHLECAAGVGSLAVSLASGNRTVIAADLSLKSLAHIGGLAHATGKSGRILPVVADITSLPFADHTFMSVTSAETLEHIPDHRGAVDELARVLAADGWLVGTVPAVPTQWSEWDEWAGHLRRYSITDLEDMLRAAGLEAEVTIWGWPFLRVYDEFFLKQVNRRRLHTDGAVVGDKTLRRISGLGRRRALVTLVRSIFAFDRLFDGVRWGVGLLFAARKLR